SSVRLPMQECHRLRVPVLHNPSNLDSVCSWYSHTSLDLRPDRTSATYRSKESPYIVLPHASDVRWLEILVPVTAGVSRWADCLSGSASNKSDTHKGRCG